jgi:hypothetical protein
LRNKSAAQTYLEQVEKLDVQIECKLAEIQQMRELATHITQQIGGERVQSSGSKDKMADAVAKCLMLEEETAGTVDCLIRAKKEVTSILDRLDNPTEYKLLHLRYIQYKSLKEIADVFGSDYTWVTTCHGRALKSVQAVLDE